MSLPFRYMLPPHMFHASPSSSSSSSPSPSPPPRRATATTCLLIASIYLPQGVYYAAAAAGPLHVCGIGRGRPHRRWKRHPAAPKRARPREQIPTRAVAERRRLLAPGDKASFVVSAVHSKNVGQRPSTRTPSLLLFAPPCVLCVFVFSCPPRTLGGQTGTTNSSTLAVAGVKRTEDGHTRRTTKSAPEITAQQQTHIHFHRCQIHGHTHAHAVLLYFPTCSIPLLLLLLIAVAFATAEESNSNYLSSHRLHLSAAGSLLCCCCCWAITRLRNRQRPPSSSLEKTSGGSKTGTPSRTNSDTRRGRETTALGTWRQGIVCCFCCPQQKCGPKALNTHALPPPLRPSVRPLCVCVFVSSTHIGRADRHHKLQYSRCCRGKEN
ncbi:hypothetical protein MOQ_010083 [Trypanosoma cruzi marinkellei]|uniref:Uncharacterized protein n=1 Tax=Trypanosoma cruzi marinkellei TaxID=85056 RepID=K2MKI3_TRYCR|nr:hypothetical protein MOQ_010083 [Trypanosoma cruzi marinkellei]